MTFEKTYPRYPFSELVALGLAAGRGVLEAKAWLRSAARHRPVWALPGRKGTA